MGGFFLFLMQQVFSLGAQKNVRFFVTYMISYFYSIVNSLNFRKNAQKNERFFVHSVSLPNQLNTKEKKHD